MFFVVLLIIVAGIVFYRYVTKDKREERTGRNRKRDRKENRKRTR